jgi:hypothetical protein
VMKARSFWLQIAIGLSVSTTIVSAQSSVLQLRVCSLQVQCLPTLSQFTCEATCKADLSPAVTVRSATATSSCEPPIHAR